MTWGPTHHQGTSTHPRQHKTHVTTPGTRDQAERLAFLLLLHSDQQSTGEPRLSPVLLLPFRPDILMRGTPAPGVCVLGVQTPKSMSLDVWVCSFLLQVEPHGEVLAFPPSRRCPEGAEGPPSDEQWQLPPPSPHEAQHPRPTPAHIRAPAARGEKGLHPGEGHGSECKKVKDKEKVVTSRSGVFLSLGWLQEQPTLLELRRSWDPALQP